MDKIIQSAWWIVYYIDKISHTPKFLMIKRFALSKKIEWVAPKWKIQWKEKPIDAALREVCEETSLNAKDLHIIDEIWVLSLALRDAERWNLDKDITFFLIEYKWDPTAVKIEKVEWYLWFYKWATIQEITNLVYYEDLRKIFKAAYNRIVSNWKK